VRLPLAVALFLALHALLALASTGRVRTTDEYMALFQSLSLLERGSTAVPQAVQVGHFYGKLDPRGEPRAPYAPGHALAAAPWTALGRSALARASGVPPEASDLAIGFAATLSSAAFSAAAAALALALWRRLGVPERPATLAALALALGTPLLSYGGWFYSEPLSAAVLVGAALALFGGGGASARVASADTPVGSPDTAGGTPDSRPDTPVTLSRAVAAGLLLGAAVWVRPTQLIAFPAFALALLVRDGRRSLPGLTALGLAFAWGPLAYLAYNHAIFGSAFDFGYPDAAEGGRRLNEFSTPLLTGLSGFLVSPGKSILLFAPPLLFAWAGLPALARRDRGLAALSVAAPLAYLLFYARFAQWEGGYCYGPRYLVPALALACLPLGPALADAGARGRRALLGLALAGCLVQAIGLGTSFLEDQRRRDPRGGTTYYDAEWRYRWGHAPIVSQAGLALAYAASAAPAPLGKGFDRWPLFLEKGGVARGTCVAIALALAASGLMGALGIAQRLRGAAVSDVAEGVARPSPGDAGAHG